MAGGDACSAARTVQHRWNRNLMILRRGVSKPNDDAAEMRGNLKRGRRSTPAIPFGTLQQGPGGAGRSAELAALSTFANGLTPSDWVRRIERNALQRYWSQ